MHCSNCKAKVNPGDKKCLNCGATLIWNNKKKQPLKTKNTKEKVKDKNKVKEKTPQKRPISILLVSLLGGVFILSLLPSIFATYNSLFSVSICLTVFAPIFFIISLVLLLVNKRKNKKRTKYFAITTIVLAALIIISAVGIGLARDSYKTANSYFEQKKYGLAIEEYQEVINKSEDEDKIIDSKNKIEEAEAYIKETKGYVAKGDDYFDENQLDKALSEYGKAYEIYPYLSGLEQKISVAKSEKKEQEIAEAETKAQLEINEKLNNADDLYNLKKYEEALEKYKEILSLDRKNTKAKEKIGIIEDIIKEVEGLVNEGDKFFKKKDYKTSMYLYKQGEDLYPNYPQIELKISQCENALKEEKELEEEIAEEEVVEEPPEEEITQESDEEFYFDEYIEKSKVREYKIIEEEEISLKALGDKSLSEYTSEELDKLPKNYRMKYSITIPRDITEDELKSTLSQIIKEKSTENLEIDEIVVFAWYFEESVGKAAAMGRAEWCPNGEWGGLPPEIAENNIRNSYKIIFSINIQEYEEEEKYGLTESERMQAFYDLVELQDLIPFDDPEWDEKNDESYEIIAEKYGITRDQMFAIGVEGVANGWPMPEL